MACGDRAVSFCLRRAVLASLVLCGWLAGQRPVRASPECPAEQSTPQVPTDLGLCASLEPVIRKPSALPLDQYEAKLGRYIRAFCYRDPQAGWKSDKAVRDTGPFTARFVNGQWIGTYRGTHGAVIIWYSKEMYGWLKANRPADAALAPAAAQPVPDGAVMVKEMYPVPGSRCRGIDPLLLRPTSGAAVMVRDFWASRDGWFWGWFGWEGWTPDWPAAKSGPYPNMGFGQYCTNCHASARDNSTFASLSNIKGEPGTYLSFLSQDSFLNQSGQIAASLIKQLDQHSLVASRPEDSGVLRHIAEPPYNADFVRVLRAPELPAPSAESIVHMPPQTYDNVWVAGGGPTAASEFVTSDQCIGCHDAGATGLQFDMTEPLADGKLANVSPYGSWRLSPMGLAGRDPIFYAQMASETERFHPRSPELVQDTCIGCHGVLGHRQFAIDRYLSTGKCGQFPAGIPDSAPWPHDNSSAFLARYGALVRDGVSCTACHHMAIGQAAAAKYRDRPQNHCTLERQTLLNPENTGFAKTLTGSFLAGAPDTLDGPFESPKPKPMKQALGIRPEHNEQIKSSEACGTCHAVHLPVLRDGKPIGYAYEQTTYAEWAFSDYRTGSTADGALPLGAGARAQSCQTCHMPSKDADGHPYRSKIASIQEYSNFPQAEYSLGPEDLDLPIRNGFAKHVLVGLNVFLIRMAQQFPEVLGVRTQDPMLVGKGLDPAFYTEDAMLDQAAHRTADIAVTAATIDASRLNAEVTITNRTGHKFPSGVGFRRAFVEFDVLDANGRVLWASGRTDRAGVIVDDKGQPVAGEMWWNKDCSERLDAGHLAYQPHYERISRQDQAQIYQELLAAPPAGSVGQCRREAPGSGELTTSFLSICSTVKDNRLLPHGFLALPQREAIAGAIGAGPDLAEQAGPAGVGEDADYRSGGGDALVYSVDLTGLPAPPASVQATLYYQATPPYFLQDRFCTSKSAATKRLYFLAGHLDLAGTAAQDWKLKTVTTGPVRLAR